MDQQQFDQLAAAGYNRIPVVREIFADLDTPLSVYLKLADGPNTYLLESVEGGEQWGRHSIIGLPAATTIEVHGRTWRERRYGEVVAQRQVADPLAEVEALRVTHRVPELDGLPRFAGGLVGYFGYETVQFIEPRLAGVDKPDKLGNPDILLMLSDEIAVFDNLAGKLFLIVHADPAREHALAHAERRLDRLVHRLRHGTPGYPVVSDPRSVEEADFSSGFERAEFESAVDRAQAYIRAGDVMQVVLSQRLSIPLSARPVDVYRALRSSNPSPYLYFLDLGEFQIVGSSPEILVRRDADEAVVRPIAGTRRRGRDGAEDAHMEAELRADPKELAEHVMLIDLGRNDLGRVAEVGSVRLTERMVVERYSHVMHLVSEVRAKLAEGVDLADLLRATFPAGTLSGAPKVRAMEIIAELEPVKRGIYGGAVGYLGWDGDMDMAIAIRTAVIEGGRLHVQAGAGIVADSDPAREWQETMNKGRAMFHAVAAAAGGL